MYLLLNYYIKAVPGIIFKIIGKQRKDVDVKKLTMVLSGV